MWCDACSTSNDENWSSSILTASDVPNGLSGSITLLMKTLMMLSGFSWSGDGGPPIRRSPSSRSNEIAKHGISTYCRICSDPYKIWYICLTNSFSWKILHTLIFLQHFLGAISLGFIYASSKYCIQYFSQVPQTWPLTDIVHSRYFTYLLTYLLNISHYRLCNLDKNNYG